MLLPQFEYAARTTGQHKGWTRINRKGWAEQGRIDIRPNTYLFEKNYFN